MKQCPVCKTAYTDDSLKFCLSDGASLTASPSAEKTVQMSFGRESVETNASPDSVPTVFAPADSPAPARKGLGLIVVGLLALFLLVAVAGFAAFMLLKPGADKNSVAVNASPTPAQSVAPTAAPLDETAALKEKLANLEKQVQAQKNQKQTAPAQSPAAQNQTPNQTARTARVNSPGDGFLALRGEPDSKTGYLIAKIPHGANVAVQSCPKSSNVGKIPGRWCQVLYNGQAGWAFDGFLVY